jgi:predicted lipoprotein with Yx(FWY)xxD motif
VNRRQYLETTIVTVTTGALAGCSGSGGGGGGSDGSDDGGNGTTGDSGGGAATTGDGGATTTGGAGQMTGTTEGGETTTGSEMTTSGGGAPAVKVVSNDEYGKILVGADGLSLYLFEKDEKGKSTCQGACAKAWPPLTTSDSPAKGSGVTASLGTISREGGSTQLTAAGHPLYYYAPDKKPGLTKGQELKQFGAEWYLLAPDGSKVEGEGEEGGESTTTTGSGSGSGY